MNTSLFLDPRYDELLTSINQIEALLDVVTSVDLTELKSDTLSNYFWVIIDLLHKAKGVCENLANIDVCLPSILEKQNHAN